jgi:hypothetical protein
MEDDNAVGVHSRHIHQLDYQMTGRYPVLQNQEEGQAERKISGDERPFK